jgi:hypothetical protein
MMFRRLQKQLHDTELEIGSGTMYRYSGATLPLLFFLKFRLPVSNVVA